MINVTSKIFTKVLNDRLVKWANQEQKMYENQCGFTKGKSTVDQLFILNTLIHKYLSKRGGRFYTAFVDFAKAFDTIPHQHLWFSLYKHGVHGNIISVLRSMYCKLKSAIQVKNGITEYFKCEIGTRQGCILSPFLFIFYLNEFTEMCRNECLTGVYVNENLTNIVSLLFADDMVLCADTVFNLQKQLNLLKLFCDKWGMKVNLDKTNVIVYRNGGIIKSYEKWWFNGVKIQTSSYYKYLGLMVSSRGSWTTATKTLAQQASKALFFINRLKKYNVLPFDIACSLFDKMVVPILVYGAEIWGFKCYESIENIHRKFIRQQLGLGTKTCNIAIYGETGRYPLHVIYKVKCIKYWLKLSEMENCRYTKACYDMQYNLCENGRQTWASCIKKMLCESGFMIVWLCQSVGDKDAFLFQFRQRITDMWQQEWHSGLDSPKLRTYITFKTNFVQEKYLSCLNIRKNVKALAKFRCSNHQLQIEVGRHNNISIEKRLCKFCLTKGSNVIEDEFHVLLVCDKYLSLREMYIDKMFTHPPSYQKFINIMSSTNQVTLMKLSVFLINLFKQII